VNDTDFDRQFAELGGVAPPDAVSARTLAAFRRERAQGAWKVRIVAFAGMAAMAALSLVVVAPPEQGDPAAMVERGGGGGPVATVDLRAAVRSGNGEIARFAANGRYVAGDTLMFRVTTSAPLSLSLRRDGVLVWAGDVPAGATDLPLAWRFEAGEGPAVFTLSGGPEPLVLRVPAVAP
jgi:hypothetical protein